MTGWIYYLYNPSFFKPDNIANIVGLGDLYQKLGFDYIFDTNLGADITTFEEAGECVNCLKKDKMVLTSCCPAWVKFVEFNYPEFVKNISTTKSPQMCLGAVVKTYFAEKMKIDPKKIVMVSIMPCVAKKFEINRPEFKTRGLKTIDYVLTTQRSRNSICKPTNQKI